MPETSSSSELILSGDDAKTSGTEETVSRRFEFRIEDDDNGSESGSREDDTDSSFKSHPSDDSGADGDSAPESPSWKRTF